mgnify:CR=1 FL=1
MSSNKLADKEVQDELHECVDHMFDDDLAHLPEGTSAIAIATAIKMVGFVESLERLGKIAPIISDDVKILAQALEDFTESMSKLEDVSTLN